VSDHRRDIEPDEVLDPAEPFDARQAAMHGLLHVFYAGSPTEEKDRADRILEVISRHERAALADALARQAESLRAELEHRAAQHAPPLERDLGRWDPARPAGHDQFRTAVSSPRQRRHFAFVVTALVLLVVGAFAWQNPLRRNRPSPPARSAQGPETQRERGFQHVRLASGQMRELALGDLGSIMVQGPADLDLLGTSRARLRQGRIRVRITSETGRGFMVQTPRADVIDLGTEFGVEVAPGSDDTGVVVFEGAVDMAVDGDGSRAGLQVEHLSEGDGVVIRGAGQLDRLMSIVTGTTDWTYQQTSEASAHGAGPIIADVRDNLSVSQSKKAYQIVPGGLREDARCYADRPRHEWNGLDENGMPERLIGADYVRTFESTRSRKDIRIYVRLARPARLFVFLDRRIDPPRWLRRDFRETGERIGLDKGPYRIRKNVHATFERGIGAGISVDHIFSVWERLVEQPGEVELGPNPGGSGSAMYGIAAVALDRPGGGRATVAPGVSGTRPAGE
jgi:ferric-dicitrate binding protein FerR (iron transport regulator)